MAKNTCTWKTVRHFSIQYLSSDTKPTIRHLSCIRLLIFRAFGDSWANGARRPHVILQCHTLFSIRYLSGICPEKISQQSGIHPRALLGARPRYASKSGMLVGLPLVFYFKMQASATKLLKRIIYFSIRYVWEHLFLCGYAMKSGRARSLPQFLARDNIVPLRRCLIP